MDSERVLKLAADIREVDGAHQLGAAELAEKLVEKGWVLEPQQLTVPVLTSHHTYAAKDYVQVLKDGTWTDGVVSEQRHGLVSVDTERGPMTVGVRSTRIRPQKSPEA